MKRLALLMLAACGGDETAEKAIAPCEKSIFYADVDGDGFGDPFVLESACDAPDGHVDNRDDCNDNNDDEYPGKIWHRDVDGDGFGDETSALSSCHRPVGYIEDDTDCDDMDSTRYPGATWYGDTDDDGFGDIAAPTDACGDVSGAAPNDLDCDDDDWLTHPEANEVCDGLDNDCDALVDDDDVDVDLFTQVPVFVDEDGDGYGTEESLGRACPTSTIGAFEAGDCDDTDPDIHPHRLDFNDELDSDCDGTEDMYVVSSSKHGWIGGYSSSAFATFVIAKDLDGDGLNEVVSSAYNIGDDNVGAIMLIPGDLEGDQTTWPEDDVRGWMGDAIGGKLGYFGMAFAGDWDGDGIEDIVAGAPNHNENAGMAYIFSTEMEDETVAGSHLIMEFPVTDSYWGITMTGLGDINEDGLDDVLIGARKDSADGSNRGSVTVVLGGSTEVGDLTIHGATNGDQFGFMVANVGDPDGDGMTDVLIGAPYGDEGVGGGGDVILMSTADLLATTPVTEDSTVFYGMQSGEIAGVTVSAVGDFDGDGLDDMLIGAANYDVLDSNEGAAYLVLGSSDGWASMSLDDAHLKMLGANAEDKAGRYIGAPGDITGDGLHDIFVTAHNWTGEEERMGLSYGVLGGHSGGTIALESEADLLIRGDGKNDYLGRGIAPAGDTDGDGVDDFWMGASGGGSTGTLYLVQGASSGW